MSKEREMKAGSNDNSFQKVDNEGNNREVAGENVVKGVCLSRPSQKQASRWD